MRRPLTKSATVLFPELEDQNRPYHSIPSLQVNRDPAAYKSLQDVTHLQQILEGAMENTVEANTIEDIKKAEIPRTNPVNLIFSLVDSQAKISTTPFESIDSDSCFFKLVTDSFLSSKKRATAFLWRMWYYLESDFSANATLNNPYGRGHQARRKKSKMISLERPEFESLTSREADLENVDTAGELEFGELKLQQRLTAVASNNDSTAKTVHSDMLDKIKALALAHKDQGKLTEAEQMYFRALEGYRKALGPTHALTLNTANELGLLFAAQGRLDEEQELYISTLNECKSAPTEGSLRAKLGLVNNLGRLYAHQGKLSEAIEMYRQVQLGYENIFGPAYGSKADMVDRIAELESTLLFQKRQNKVAGLRK